MSTQSLPSAKKFIRAAGNAGQYSGIIVGLIIATALIFFEMFNYSTTDYALADLLGDLNFAGIRWATLLAIAFCGIDFAGVARLFTPEQGKNEHHEVWYLFGAWLLAATMNAALTWWGVSMAIVNHTVQSSAVVDAQTIIKVVPIFVAIMVWIIRILIIGSLSIAGDRLLWGNTNQMNRSPARRSTATAPRGATSSPISPAVRRASSTRPRSSVASESSSRPEPSYHSVSMSGQSEGQSARQL
jgi:hypothetical protein